MRPPLLCVFPIGNLSRKLRAGPTDNISVDRGHDALGRRSHAQSGRCELVVHAADGTVRIPVKPHDIVAAVEAIP